VLRSMLVAGVAATALSLVLAPGPVEAAPAPSLAPSSATHSPDPLAGLTLHPEWGSVTGNSGVLKRGCHKYTYSYSIEPPEGIWALEIFITGPGFKHLAGGAFLDGYDPKTGSGRYTLCRVTTRYGTFTIDAKLSSDNGSGHITEGRLPSDTYRLRAPR
jgi:hypothetical protein